MVPEAIEYTVVSGEVTGRLACEPPVILPVIFAVELFVDLAEVRVGDMRVDLCSINRGVAEELLH